MSDQAIVLGSTQDDVMEISDEMEFKSPTEKNESQTLAETFNKFTDLQQFTYASLWPRIMCPEEWLEIQLDNERSINVRSLDPAKTTVFHLATWFGKVGDLEAILYPASVRDFIGTSGDLEFKEEDLKRADDIFSEATIQFREA